MTKPIGGRLERGAVGEVADKAGAPTVRFPAHPDARVVAGRKFRLGTAYQYTWRDGSILHRLTAPAGFVYDGASVPRIVWSLYPPQPLDRAAVMHDLLYRRGGELEPGEHQWSDRGIWRDVEERWTRKEADQLFRRMLDEDPSGPGKVKRWAAYWGVRSGGYFAWRG